MSEKLRKQDLTQFDFSCGTALRSAIIIHIYPWGCDPVSINGNIGRVLACVLIGYLLGSINPAYLIVRRKGYDVREEGSGNAGASNALIIAGKAAFLTVVVLDILKAWASCRICRGLFPTLTAAEQIGGAACVMGHLFPATLGFRGGKGLACQGGVVLSWSWKWFLLLLGAAILLAVVTKYVCFVSPSLSVTYPLIFWWRTGFLTGALVLLMPALPIILKHLENFRRIRSGQEARLSFLWNRDAELERLGRK